MRPCVMPQRDIFCQLDLPMKSKISITDRINHASLFLLRSSSYAGHDAELQTQRDTKPIKVIASLGSRIIEMRKCLFRAFSRTFAFFVVVHYVFWGLEPPNGDYPVCFTVCFAIVVGGGGVEFC